MVKNALMALVAGTMLALPAQAMDLHSVDVTDGAAMAKAQIYGRCGGQNISPALAWSGAPNGTQSFALTMFDPDAGDAGWWHWIAYAIPKTVTHLEANAGRADTAAFKQGANDFHKREYDGPCPPAGSGPHHYQITLYALDVTQPDLQGADAPAKARDIFKAHALASATLTGIYER
ncbi:MAG TPA: YbhB/YbcL family Raf kinase inhibitor-like protein [Rhizomicrobium sp.]|nr:YbhB/YbcL family Raf kinase inhibitor-like protein [Rhizomicrobium sp.]